MLVLPDRIPTCAAPIGVASVPFKRVPPVLIQALRDYVGDRDYVGEIVAPGEKFDTTDVVWTGRSRRFAFFWTAGDRWIIATEHGGFAYNDSIFVYHLDEGDRKTVLVKEQIAFPTTVCAVASNLIAAP
jgi:hypothetical protein